MILEVPRVESPFERSRYIGKFQDISLDLKPFGYEFFREAAVMIATQRKDVPVPLKYVIGPGDEIKILLSTDIQNDSRLMIYRQILERAARLTPFLRYDPRPLHGGG
jgi:hypothetical protein